MNRDRIAAVPVCITRCVTVCIVALLWAVTPARAQDDQQAGLIVVHGDGTLTQQCVAFAEESISGYELLKRAGVAMRVEAGSIGATVCSIDGEGCAFPQESCFCRCEGGPCTYWSYWRLADDGWQYQNLGAGNTKVRNGDVEAWHWAEGTPKDAKKPPPVTFDALCAAPTPTAPSLSNAAAATPLPASAPTSSAPTSFAPGQPMTILGLVLIGLVVMPAAVLAVLVLIRKQQGR